MARAATQQDSFAGGEISPLSYGRVTIPRYKECLAICQNYVPILQGPATRRPGTTFVGRTRYANQKSRLIPFSFSTSQNYIIEISGSGFIRFYKNGAPLLRQDTNTNSITAATNGTTLSITGTF